MKNKILIPLLIIGALIAFFSFKHKINEKQSSEERRSIVIETVIKAIQNAHYSPRQLNDSFSSKVYHKFLEQIDYDKLFFTKNEVEKFKPYEFLIDDEIRMGSIEFYDSVDAVYMRGINRADMLYQSLLATEPFTFSGDEQVNLDAQKEEYAADDAALRTRWYLRLKYRVLATYTDLKKEQDKKKENKDSVGVTLKTNDELIGQAKQDILKSYQRYFKRMRKIKSDERFALFVNEITTTEDPHTEYFPPREKKGFDEMMSGSFFGIGAQLKSENDKTIITAIITGSPSWRKGELKPNDEIMKVAQGDGNPVDIAGFEINDVVKLIRGEKGTEVRLTVKKTDGSIKVVSITRDVVQIEETFAKSAIIKTESGRVGYIFLPEFYADFNHTSGRRCARDVEIEVRKLKEEGVAGIIIDLRSNSGGSLSDVVDMSGIFVGRKPVVQVKRSSAAPSVLYAQGIDTPQYSGPLVIMVSEGSASASEILAAAMQDYKRAVIVGSNTFGKGTVQKMVSLDDQLDGMTRFALQNDTSYVDGYSIGSVKMTMEKFYRVNGGSTQLKGVVPDISLPDIYEYEDEDMGERHNKSALPWDEIPPAKYEPTNSIKNLDQLVKQSHERISDNGIFNLIEQNAALIKKRKDNNVVSLNEGKYKKDQEELNGISKKLEELQKSSSKLELENLKADMERINLDSASITKNKEWLKRLGKDVYISETVNIVDDMVKQSMSVRNKRRRD